MNVAIHAGLTVVIFFLIYVVARVEVQIAHLTTHQKKLGDAVLKWEKWVQAKTHASLPPDFEGISVPPGGVLRLDLVLTPVAPTDDEDDDEGGAQ